MAAGTDDLRNAVTNDGFWTIEDETIGKTLDELVNSGFHIQTVPGMELCNAAVFGNKLVKDTTRSFFRQSTLGFYRKFGKTKNTHCVLPRTRELRILLIFVWSSRSRMRFYPQTHLQNLGAVPAGNGLFMLPNLAEESPVIRGLAPTEVTMDHGGLAILDARIWWKIEAGTFVMFGIMTPEESEYWHKMPLPVTLSDAVSEMTDENMSMNVRFFDPNSISTATDSALHARK